MKQGFVVVEDAYPEEKRAEISAAVRRDTPPWEELKDDPPEGGLLKTDFAYDNMRFNHFILDEDLIGFVGRVLDTEQLHFRYAHNWTRYPNAPKVQPDLHIDNVNNSLLPPCEDVRFGQISSWYFPEEVTTETAPMRIIPKPFGKDTSKSVYVTGPGNMLMIFNTHLWHSATTFDGVEGQRYSVSRIYGRADHYWEGVFHYTNASRDENLRKFIPTLTARQREYFRFPPAGHHYYNEKTLAALEENYPGWNSRGEY